MLVTGTPSDTSQQVFVSHASRDRAAVDRLVDLLVETGAGRLSVFCTSSPGLAVPSGQDFFSHTKSVLIRSALVVHFVTPAFLSSNFCMLELGASWAQDKAFVLIAPPLTHKDLVGGPLSSLQGADLASGDGLDQLRDRITDLAELPVRYAGWAARRSRALRDITDALDRSQSREIKRLAAVGVRDHHLEIWALNGEGRIAHSWWRNDAGAERWNKPRFFAAPAEVVDIAVASRGPEHAEVFALDNHGILRRRSWARGVGWSPGWTDFDRRVAGPITACSYKDGHIEVFAIDPETSSVIHSWCETEDWHGWRALDVGLVPDDI